jgi:hypothetical protein
MKHGLIQPSTRERESAAVPSACWSGLSGTDLGLAMQAGVRPGLEGRGLQAGGKSKGSSLPEFLSHTEEDAAGKAVSLQQKEGSLHFFCPRGSVFTASAMSRSAPASLGQKGQG